MKKDIPMSTFPIVGRTINVPSKTFAPIKNRSKTCFLTGTMFPLTVWILNSGAESSWRRAAGWTVRMRRSFVSERALWIAPVSSRPKVSYSRNWSGTYSIFSFLVSCRVALNSRILYFSFFCGLFGCGDLVCLSPFGWSGGVLSEFNCFMLWTLGLRLFFFGLIVYLSVECLVITKFVVSLVYVEGRDCRPVWFSVFSRV